MTPTPSFFGTPRELALDLAIMTAVGVFFGLIGPFGTFYAAQTDVRVAYWVANIWIGYFVISTTVRLSMRAAIQLDIPVWCALAMGVAIGAVPLSLGLGFFSALVWPPNHGQMAPYFRQYGQVLAISEPFAFVYFYVVDRGWNGAVEQARLAKRGPDERPAEAPSSASAGGRFLDRLPARLGRELLCLQMEDHYVRAHTPAGSDLILTPLKDAIAELTDVEGMQVHRSWWVARGALVGPVSEGRNLFLRLSNGLTVPVSRASVARLRAAGWLDEPYPGA